MCAQTHAGTLIFRNVCPEWGLGVKSRLQPDKAYLIAQFDAFQPDLVIVCGQIAESACLSLWLGNLICMPHPASRSLTNVLLDDCARTVASFDPKVATRLAFRQNKGSHTIELL